MDSAKELYFDLMKRCLTNWIYGATEEVACPVPEPLAYQLKAACAPASVRVVRPQPFNEVERMTGRDWPPQAHTMTGIKRLDNLQHCVERVLQEGVAGDFIETGVWRGGSCIFMRAILKAYGVTDRNVWVADSFEGLPQPDVTRYPADQGDVLYTFTALAISIDQVKANFAAYGLLDEQVRFLKGWFRDTLPKAPRGPLAVVRLDGDMYESTMDGLTNLYPRLSPGGYLIVDDYGCIPACKQAVHDYRAQHGIEEDIIPVDWTGAYWRKSKDC